MGKNSKSCDGVGATHFVVAGFLLRLAAMHNAFYFAQSNRRDDFIQRRLLQFMDASLRQVTKKNWFAEVANWAALDCN